MPPVPCAVEAHVVERQVALLRRQPSKRQRLLRVAMVARRINPVRHEPADHTVLHPLCVERIEVRPHDRPHLFHHRPPVIRQAGKVGGDGGGGTLHGGKFFRGYLFVARMSRASEFYDDILAEFQTRHLGS